MALESLSDLVRVFPKPLRRGADNAFQFPGALDYSPGPANSLNVADRGFPNALPAPADPQVAHADTPS